VTETYSNKPASLKCSEMTPHRHVTWPSKAFCCFVFRYVWTLLLSALKQRFSKWSISTPRDQLDHPRGR